MTANYPRPAILRSGSPNAKRISISALDWGEVERKIFWLIFGALCLIADFVLPFWWGLVATIPILFLSWWVVYRSDWF